MYRKTVSLIFIFLAHSGSLLAQEKTTGLWSKVQEAYQIKGSIGLQMQGTYTLGQKIYDPQTEAYQDVDNRWNTQIRRTRFNLSGQPYPNLSFKFTAALDLVGRDLLSATQGGVNNGGSPSFGLWNAYVQWQVINQKDALHLTAGYLVPQIGRASITSAMRSISFEKSWSQNYLRRTLVGTGPGRAMGLNLGGQILPSSTFGLSYDAGLFNPINNGFTSNTQGNDASLLLVGRLVFHFGDPEFKRYSISHKINYFGERTGLSLALAASHRGNSDLFKNSQTIGLDWLWSIGKLSFDGELNYLSRTNSSYTSSANVGYYRISYTLPLANNAYLEPVLMYVRFNGPLDQVTQSEAMAIDAFAGKDEIMEWNLNYYLNPNFKLSLSYTHNQGDFGAAAPGADFNNHYFQSGIGAIDRGDLIGLGMVLII